MENFEKEIIQGIEYIIDKKIGKMLSPDIVAKVIESDGNMCTVQYNNNNYKVRNGTGIAFKTGDTCLIHCINYNRQNKVIIAKL